MGSMSMHGSDTVEKTANLGKLNVKVEKLTINDNYDVLSVE